MSKLAHSHEPTMHEIERKAAIQNFDLRRCSTCGAENVIDEPDCPRGGVGCNVVTVTPNSASAAMPDVRTVAAGASEAAAGPIPATVATVPSLLVYLEDETGHLHWKPDDVKGARWRNSKSPNIEVVCAEADEVMPERYEIDYVTEKR